MLGWILGRLPTLSAILAGIAGAALLAALFEHARVARVVYERNTARDEVQRQALALSSKDAAIAALEAAVEKWQKLVTPATDVTEAARRANAAAASLEAQSKKLATREAADHAKPDCAALLAADVGSVCPAIANGVRERADYRIP